MKSKLCLLIVLCCVVKFGIAQNTTVVLDKSMFDHSLQTIALTGLNGWIFRQGNDTNWSKSEIDTTPWINFNPVQPTAKNADKTGRFEGWFRMRFKLDTSFDNSPIGICALRWAATDIYIDGNYITSSGNTGLNGKPYEENREALPSIHPLQIETGKEHVLAVHIVDYVAPLNHRFLKTESFSIGFGPLVQLSGPLASKNATGRITRQTGSGFLYSGILGFLSLLFWFLYFQSRREKYNLSIAISTSLFFAQTLLITIWAYPFDLDFNRWWLVFFIAVQFWPLMTSSMLYTVGEIFNFRYQKTLVIFGILYLIFCLHSFYFQKNYIGWEIPLVLILLLYIPLSSRKRPRGAQWPVVAGIIFTAIFAFTYSRYDKFQNGGLLSFPLSLMIYVAMRFKEILMEVEANANQVVQLSEERKQQAIKQQIILEEEVARQTVELRTSLENLRSTQAQLIQSEKMASLGELTAGIAHEIQNPLNFVNNFSEVNKELIEELKQERNRAQGTRNEQLENDILNDIGENEQKINHHGKRADAIVKGMLQHSRTSSGQRELTDINALADEYLRLAYQGLRAKDKSFNAKCETDFDHNVGKINIVPQEMGRVMLNLINNAFYAVSEKKKHVPDDYEPTVTLTTVRDDGKIEVKVKDNGNGISGSIVDKIFQPFFTTKPTGQGTGLGLSLAYDIIKVHGGEIKVKTKEGEGSEFVVQLPVA